MELDELQANLSGLMSFPITPFGAHGELNVPRLRQHVRDQLATDARALFIACGTGEFFSLSSDEHREVVRVAVEEAGGEKPVLAGVGYGGAIAREMAVSAERAGADGLLVLPPYLVSAEQEGLYEHYRSVAAAVSIGVIIYQRDNALLDAGTVQQLAAIPNVIGLKDGHGDTDRLTRARVASDGQLALMNGMPTAELTAAPYRACGVQSYSSAVLNFVPEIAERFFAAHEMDDDETMDRLIAGFYRPFVELRDERAGYAVSLVKAGVNVRSNPVGDVRAPLLPPTSEHLERLEKIIAEGLALV